MTTKAIAIRVPFHAAAMGEEEVQAVSEVIRSGWLTMGARTFEFERQFASYVGAPYAIAVSSCTPLGTEIMAASHAHPIVYFVGSIPLPDSETVFRTLAAAAGLLLLGPRGARRQRMQHERNRSVA